MFQVKLYRKRWLILFLFCCCSMCNSFQWIHLNIISDRVLYVWRATIPGSTYDVRQLAVDWLSMVYLLTYIPLIIPCMWVLERYGLRVTTITGVSLNAVGAWLKCVAGALAVANLSTSTFTAAAAYPLLMTAQTLDAIAQLFILGIPAHLAATWFGDREISTATSIGVLANQLGVGIGFGLPPLIVPPPPSSQLPTGNSSSNTPAGDLLDAATFEHIHESMMYLLYGGAVFSTLPIIPIYFFFKAEPPIPPTYAQHARRLSKPLCDSRNGSTISSKLTRASRLSNVSNPGDQLECPLAGMNGFHEENGCAVAVNPISPADGAIVEPKSGLHGKTNNFKRDLISILRNRSFVLLLVSYGVNVGIYYALGTLLNLILQAYFPADAHIGWIGFTMVLAGIVGSIVAGLILDRYKKYKLVTVGTYALTVLWMIGFTGLLLLKERWIAYVASFLLGFTMTGFLPIGFEFAAELTYPAAEGLTSGLLNGACQFFGIIFTLSASQTATRYDVMYTNLLLTILVAMGFLLVLFIKEDLRRLRMQGNVSLFMMIFGFFRYAHVSNNVIIVVIATKPVVLLPWIFDRTLLTVYYLQTNAVVLPQMAQITI